MLLTSVSALARRCPSRPIDRRDVYTAAHRVSAIVVGCILRAPCKSATSPPGAVNTRLTAGCRPVYIALVDGRNFPSPEFGTKFQREVLLFLETSLISLQHSVTQADRNLYAKNQPDPCSRFTSIPACDTTT